jgi:ribokinase
LVESDSSYKSLLEFPAKMECKTTMTGEEPYLINTPVMHENFYFCMRRFFKEILKMGPKIVVVTNGCNGVYAATGNEVVFHPSMKIKVIDSVGAGDAFGSCFVAHMMLGYNVDEALRLGIVNSASVLKHVGAKKGLMSKDQLDKEAKKLGSDLVQRFDL